MNATTTSRRKDSADTINAKRRPQKLQHRIKMSREAANLSQSELSRRLGIRPQTVNQWESGYKNPSRDHILGLSNVCNVPIDWLLMGHRRTGLTAGNIPATIIPGQITGRTIAMYQSLAAALQTIAPKTTDVPSAPTGFISCLFGGPRSFAFPLPDDRCGGSQDRSGDVWVVDPDAPMTAGRMVVAMHGSDAVYGELRYETSATGTVIVIAPTDTRWPQARSDAGHIELVAALVERRQPAR